VPNNRSDSGAVETAVGGQAELLTLSNYLGILRDDPEDEGAFAGLRALVAARDESRLGAEPVRLLEMARRGHERRGELGAVALLIEVEAELLGEGPEADPDFAASLWKELGRMRSEALLDADGAVAAYERAQALNADDVEPAEAIGRIGQSRRSWKKFAKRFEDEAASSTDLSLKTSLLVRAGSLVWQHRNKGRDAESDRLFKAALEVDPGNLRAAQLYELTLRARSKWDVLTELLLDSAEHGRDKNARSALYLRAARVIAHQLEDKGRAAASYERVLDYEPANAEAMGFLYDHYAAEERWDDLVAMYEQALTVKQKLEVEQGNLLQIGMVHWRMRGSPEDAEPYFARLRKLDGAHPAMLNFYREYYAKTEDPGAWLSVLGDAQRVSSEDARLELALEQAKLAAQSATPDAAIDAWKLVQRLDPDHPEVSAALRGLYRTAEKWSALADVIKAEIEATPEAQQARRVELLQELLAIYRDRLHMDGMVINVLGRILKLDPADRDTLAELCAKYEGAGRWNDLINVLSDNAEALEDRALKVERYVQVAQLWIERFSNFNQATGPLERAIELEPENREALSQLKSIYERKRAWKPLFEVLRKERSVASDPSVRLGDTIEMARLAADRLHSYPEAIALWREALDQDSAAPGALEALEKLCERERDYAGLADVLERSLSGAPSDDGRIRILQKLAALQAEKLEDAAAATRCWQRVLEIDPKHGRALRSLRDGMLAQGEWDAVEALYRNVKDFEGLADVLSHEADKAQDKQLKVDLSFRAARIFEDDLGEANRAVRSYERVLSVDPANVEAARKLAPIYESDEKWARLRAMLEISLNALGESDVENRLALLARLHELALGQLRDGEGAFGYALQAFELAPDAEDIRDQLEQTAEAAAAYDRVVQAYEARAETRPDAAVPLARRIATIALDRLGNTALGVDKLKAVLAAEPDDRTVVETLERIYRAEHRTADLHTLLEHRLERIPDPPDRWDTLRELAQLEEEVFEDAAAAAERYRTMGEIDPADRDVLIARDRLALAAERWPELCEVLERRLEAESEPAARVELGARLGQVLVQHLDEPARALDVFAGVLEQEPAHGATVAALERLHEGFGDDGGELADRVNRMLEKVYESGGRYDKLLKVLTRRLAAESDEEEVRQLRLRVAEISGSKLGDASGAYGSIETAFLEQPSDADLWDRLTEAAERAGQHRALATAFGTAIEAGGLSDSAVLELAARAARVYDETLGQPEEAEPFHKRVIAVEPTNEASFVALKELFTAGERWDELQALYRKRIADTADAEAKLDLLLQLCFLFEEILERPDQAVDTYEQVLELDPDHGAARRTLEGLYEKTERWRDLAELLRGNLGAAEGQERVDLMLRLGELCETKLSEPGEAVDHYEGVLQEQPHQLRAQEALGRMLGVEGQRNRIATILEPLYENQGAWRDLARVLEIQLDDLDTGGAQADLLLRIGEIHEQRTRDHEAAFSAYGRAVEADPGNTTAREALASIASHRDAFRRERSQVLSRVLESEDLGADLQAEILLELAVLLDEFLQDKEAAARAYERLIEIDGDNPDSVLTASRALERIHLASEDFASLVADLRRQVQFEGDASERLSLLARVAEINESMLGQVDGAIEAHRERLEIEPSDVDALRALERLYAEAERWSELVEILRQHMEFADSDDERRELGRRAGAIRDERLEDPEGAIEIYADVVSGLGPDRQTLQALAGLYERTERWEDMLETLQTEEGLCEDAGERAELQFRSGELMRLHTGDPQRALENYEAVLEYEPTHAGALAALDAIMADTESELRIDAARVAAPRYESSGAFDRLLSVLEVLQDTDDPADKLAALRRACEVAENGLASISQAYDYAARALLAGVEEPVVGELISELQRLAEASGRFADQVATLREAAPSLYDGELQVEVYRCIAEVARDRLQDAALSAEYFEKLLEDRPEDGEALDALEQLHAEAGDHRALVEVLRRKAEVAPDASARGELLTRQADILEHRLDDPDAAVEVLEELIMDAPSAAAYESLERLYSQAGRWEDLGAAYEAQLERQIGSPVELRYKLARGCHDHLDDVPRALEHLRDAVTDDLSHQSSIALLETILAGEGENRAVAAEILEPVYLTQMKWPELTSVLEARIEAELDPDEKQRLLVRLAQIHEDQLEDFEGALSVYARLFAEDPRDEETWETLTRLAKVGEQWKRLGKILAKPIDEGVEDEAMARLARYAGRLYVERIGNQHRAAQLYAAALVFEPGDRESFDAVERAYRGLEAWDQLLPLYREQADSADSDERRIDMLHRRARLQRDTTHERDEAISSFREILDLDADDKDAVAGLEALLQQAERWEELVEHLRGRIDQQLGTPAEIPLKLRLAELLETRLGDRDAAIDVYEDISQIDAREVNAMAALERLIQEPELTLRISQILDPIYRQLDQWKKLIAILEAQVELGDDPFDQARLLSEVGELHDVRGDDPALAFHAWMRAFVADPASEQARSQVDALAARMGAWDEHVQAYEAALAKTDDDALKSEMMMTVARVHDEKRGDPRAAIAGYERLAKHDPEDPSPLDALEALHTMVGDWNGLADVLERRAEQAFDVEEKGELLRRLGSVQEDLLGDHDQAVAAYKRAVEEDDADALALEALDELYVAMRRPSDLVGVLGRRIEICAEADGRVALGLRFGSLHAEQLHQPDQAIEAYQRVLDDDAANETALSALGGLFERQGRFADLLDNLGERAAVAIDDVERVALLSRAGEVLEKELGDPYEAIDRYRQALEVDPSHGSSIEALMRISKSPEQRVAAAEILEPLLRSQQRWDNLVELIEGGVAVLDDPFERRSELQRLAEVHEQGRAQPGDAFEALARALPDDPTDDTLLADLERLARELGRFERLAEVLDGAAPQVSDPLAASELYRRLARVCEEELQDDSRAIDAYVHASEQHDDATETLADLDRLYLKTERWEQLLDIMERRIGAAVDPAERTELLLRIGTLRDERFDDGRGAFIAFKEVLEGDPADERALEGMEKLGQRDALAQDVLFTLDECYRQTGALDKVAGLYDIRIRLAETDGERLRLLREAVGIWEHDLSDPGRALSSARRIFELDPADEEALSEVERLAEMAGSWEGVRGMVEGLVEANTIEGQSKRELCLRAAGWYRERVVDAAAEERCLAWAVEVDREQPEVHARLVALLREPGREVDLVERLRQWAEVEHDSGERIERLREAARLADATLGDAETAGQCYATLLGSDSEDRDALTQLARIRASQERFDEVAELLERRLSVENESDVQTQLRHELAGVLADHLGQGDRAIEVLSELLSTEPDHEGAVARLADLYTAAERFSELRELLNVRVGRTSEPEPRAELRMRIAGLLEERLGDRAGAISELAQLLDEQPGHAAAEARLEKLYLEDGQWAALVELLAAQADRQAQAGDVAAELQLLGRIAEYCEDKLQDAARAVASYERIFARDASHRHALSALLRLSETAEDWSAAARHMESLLGLQEGAEAIATAHRLSELADERLGDLELAENALQRALVIDAANEDSRERLKVLYEKHAAFAKLAEMLSAEEATLEGPEQKVALLNRIAAIYRDRLEDPASAIGYLERAVELVSDREALLGLCDLYIAANRQADAIPVLEKIIESFGGRRAKEVALYQHRLGKAHEGAGDVVKAMECYDAAFKIDLTNVHILRDLGRLCLEQGDLERAQKTYRALLLQKLKEDSGITKADVYFRLGDISFRQGDKTKAKAMLERAVAEAGQHAEAQALLQQL